MCISRCGVVAIVEDGRLTKVNADPAHPNDCICVKGTEALKEQTPTWSSQSKG